MANRIRSWLTLPALLVLLAAPDAAAERGGKATSPRVLTVLGSAELRVPPEIAVATLSVTTRDRTAQRAAAENAARSQSVLAAVRSELSGEDRAETLSYRIEPVYEYPKGGPRQLVAYEVVNSLRVRTRNLERVGAILDKASAAADVGVDSLSFELADPNRPQAEALRLASLSARLRASKAADGLGVTLRSVRRAVERAAASPPEPRPYAAAMREAAAAPTPVLPQEIRVTAEVEVTYDIE